MSSIHLKYGTLPRKCTQSWQTVSLVKKIKAKKIYDICIWFSFDICTIISAYLTTQINFECKITDNGYPYNYILTFQNDTMAFDIEIWHNDMYIIIPLFRGNGIRIYGASLINSSSTYDSTFTFWSTILNKYMLVHYGKKDYFKDYNNPNHISIKYVKKLQPNDMILLFIFNQCGICGVEIHDHKHFKELIVIIKCIMNGLRKKLNAEK